MKSDHRPGRSRPLATTPRGSSASRTTSPMQVERQHRGRQDERPGSIVRCGAEMSTSSAVGDQRAPRRVRAAGRRRRGTRAPPRRRRSARRRSARARAALVTRFGRISRRMMRARARALRPRRLHERPLAQREHGAADRPRHVDDVDHADDQRRQPQRVARDRDEAEVEAAERGGHAERDRRAGSRESPRGRRARAR